VLFIGTDPGIPDLEIFGKRFIFSTRIWNDMIAKSKKKINYYVFCRRHRLRDYYESLLRVSRMFWFISHVLLKSLFSFFLRVLIVPYFRLRRLRLSAAWNNRTNFDLSCSNVFVVPSTREWNRISRYIGYIYVEYCCTTVTCSAIVILIKFQSFSLL